MGKFWLPLVLIVIALLTSVLGIVKELLPAKLFPPLLLYLTVGLTAIGSALQFYQDYQGLVSKNKASELSAGIEPIAGALPKTFTSKESSAYAEVKDSVERFRKSPLKLFIAPSIDADTLYSLSLIAFNQRNFADAEINLEYALKLNSEHKESYNLLLQLYQTQAMHFLQKGNYEDAEARLKKAEHLFEYFPEGIDGRTVALIGYVYKSLGQVYSSSDIDRARQYWSQAEKVFKSALALNEHDASALNGLGNIYYFQNRYQEAFALHKDALSRAPNYTAAANDAALTSEALMCKALSTEKNKDADMWREEAILFWEKAILLSSKDPQFEPEYASWIIRRVNELKRGNTYICK